MSTIFSLKTDSAIVRALVQQFNALHDSVAVSDGYSSNHFHRDISGVDTTGDFSAPSSSALQVSAANASGLSSLLVLTNNIKGVLLVHFADDSAHLVADTARHDALKAIADASDLASAESLLNSMHALYEAHRVDTALHVSADTVSQWDGVPASDESSSEVLANFGKATINDHIKSAPTVGRIVLLP